MDNIDALILVVVWIAVGVIGTVVFHARAGRRSGMWYVISVILGPFSLPIGWEMSRDRHVELVERQPGVDRAGVRILAALDSSDEAQAALLEAVDIVGPRIGSIVLVHVLDYDTATLDRDTAVQQGRQILRQAASRLPGEAPDPSLEVAVGPPVDVLLDLAAKESADLIVLGHRGTGMSGAVLGDVSADVARRSPVPVMLGADPRALAR